MKALAITDAAVWCLSFTLFADYCVSVYGDRFYRLLFAGLCAACAASYVFFILRLKKSNRHKTPFIVNIACCFIFALIVFLSYFEPFSHIHFFPVNPDLTPGSGLEIMLFGAAFLLLFLLSRSIAAIFLHRTKRKDQQKQENTRRIL